MCQQRCKLCSLKPLQLKSEYIVRFESLIYSLRTLVDYLYCDKNTVKEILRVYEIALKFRNLQELPNIFVVKTILLFMSTFSSEYKYNLELAKEVLRYCFSFIHHPELQSLSSEVFFGLSNSLEVPLPLSDFEDIVKEVDHLLDLITCSNTMDTVVKSVFNLTKNYSDRQVALATKKYAFELVQSRLLKYIQHASSNLQNSSSIFCLVKLLTACFSSIDIAREPNEVQMLVSKLKSLRKLPRAVYGQDH